MAYAPEGRLHAGSELSNLHAAHTRNVNDTLSDGRTKCQGGIGSYLVSVYRRAQCPRILSSECIPPHKSDFEHRDVARTVAEHLPDGVALADIEAPADRLASRPNRG